MWFVHICRAMVICRGQSRISIVLFYGSTPHCLEQGLPLNQKLVISAGLVSQQALGLCLSSTLPRELQAHVVIPGFLHRYQGFELMSLWLSVIFICDCFSSTCQSHYSLPIFLTSVKMESSTLCWNPSFHFLADILDCKNNHFLLANAIF